MFLRFIEEAREIVEHFRELRELFKHRGPLLDLKLTEKYLPRQLKVGGAYGLRYVETQSLFSSTKSKQTILI